MRPNKSLTLLTCAAVALLIGTAGWLTFAEPQVAGEETIEQTQDQNEQMLKQIEEDREAVATGRNFTYDPAGRRDPFAALVRSGPVKKSGKRPKGIAGMLVNEIALKGVAIDPGGAAVALFQGSDNKGYTLRTGDVVYDGRVISIDPSEGFVVFRQEVDDPRRIKPYRDVVKRLYPISSEDQGSLMEEGA